MNVRIFIESTWKGPARRDGVAMWLVEAMRGDEPVTRQGFIHLEGGTETQGDLMALINAFSVLHKSCSALVLNLSGSVFAPLKNGWVKDWQENGWNNSRGHPIKHAELWEMLLSKTEMHEITVERGQHEYQLVMEDALRREFERWKVEKSQY